MKSPSIPLFQRGKLQTNAPVPPFEKGGQGGICRCVVLRSLNEVLVG